MSTLRNVSKVTNCITILIMLLVTARIALAIVYEHQYRELPRDTHVDVQVISWK